MAQVDDWPMTDGFFFDHFMMNLIPYQSIGFASKVLDLKSEIDRGFSLCV